MSLWDTIAVGDIFAIGSHAFSADDIRRFAAKYDPQPFHLDEDAASQSVLGGLCASGWHTAAVSMRLNVDFRMKMVAEWVKAGNPVPRMGPSPGIRNLKWPRPVYAGDSVAFTQTVTGKKVSASRPGWGVLEFSTLGLNQEGVPVFSFDAAVFQGTD